MCPGHSNHPETIILLVSFTNNSIFPQRSNCQQANSAASLQGPQVRKVGDPLERYHQEAAARGLRANRQNRRALTSCGTLTASHLKLKGVGFSISLHTWNYLLGDLARSNAAFRGRSLVVPHVPADSKLICGAPVAAPRKAARRDLALASPCGLPDFCQNPSKIDGKEPK